MVFVFMNRALCIGVNPIMIRVGGVSSLTSTMERACPLLGELHLAWWVGSVVVRKRVVADLVVKCKDCRFYTAFGERPNRVSVCLVDNQFTQKDKEDECGFFIHRMLGV